MSSSLGEIRCHPLDGAGLRGGGHINGAAVVKLERVREKIRARQRIEVGRERSGFLLPRAPGGRVGQIFQYPAEVVAALGFGRRAGREPEDSDGGQKEKPTQLAAKHAEGMPRERGNHDGSVGRENQLSCEVRGTALNGDELSMALFQKHPLVSWGSL